MEDEWFIKLLAGKVCSSFFDVLAMFYDFYWFSCNDYAYNSPTGCPKIKIMFVQGSSITQDRDLS